VVVALAAVAAVDLAAVSAVVVILVVEVREAVGKEISRIKIRISFRFIRG
jgi:hypothetical protein